MFCPSFFDWGSRVLPDVAGRRCIRTPIASQIALAIFIDGMSGGDGHLPFGKCRFLTFPVSLPGHDAPSTLRIGPCALFLDAFGDLWHHLLHLLYSAAPRFLE